MVVPTPPLAPATAIRLAAERAGGGLLARDPVAQRARPLRGGAHAALELLERERQRDDVADAGLHRGAQQLGRVVGAISTSPTSGNAWPISRARSITGDRAERVVERDDVDVVPAQRRARPPRARRRRRRPRARRPPARARRRSRRRPRRRSRAGAGGSLRRLRVGLAAGRRAAACVSSDSSPGRSSARRTSAAYDSA